MPGRTVDRRYLPARLTVPAGTAVAAPVTLDVDTGDVTLVAVHLTVPKGHAGLTGFAVTFMGRRLVPWDDPAEWIIANDANLVFDVDLDVSTPVKVLGYNTDIYDHAFHARLEVVDWPSVQEAPGTSLLAL